MEMTSFLLSPLLILNWTGLPFLIVTILWSQLLGRPHTKEWDMLPFQKSRDGQTSEHGVMGAWTPQLSAWYSGLIVTLDSAHHWKEKCKPSQLFLPSQMLKHWLGKSAGSSHILRYIPSCLTEVKWYGAPWKNPGRASRRFGALEPRNWK